MKKEREVDKEKGLEAMCVSLSTQLHLPTHKLIKRKFYLATNVSLSLSLSPYVPLYLSVFIYLFAYQHCGVSN